MNARPFLVVAAFIFGIVAALHLARLAIHFPVVIGSWNVPMWISIPGVIVPGSLSWWGMKLARGR